MGQKYHHLTLSERIEIYRLHCEGKSFRKIAASLGRSTSTICREFGRNCGDRRGRKGPYDPQKAHNRQWLRRRMYRRFKMSRQPALRELVKTKLAMGWSPEQISGWLTRQNTSMQISHESIYRYIYCRVKDRAYWHKLLPLQRYRRGHKRRRQGPVEVIKGRRSLAERCLEGNERLVPGHWEADLMSFSQPGAVLSVCHERQSRFTRLQFLPNKASQPLIDDLINFLAKLPKDCQQSMTFDNGTEFSYHYDLQRKLGMDTFFCAVKAPWQKGGVENSILRFRRYLPRKTNLARISAEELAIIQDRYNNTPRKCLGYRTPHEVFYNKRSVALHS